MTSRNPLLPEPILPCRCGRDLNLGEFQDRKGRLVWTKLADPDGPPGIYQRYYAAGPKEPRQMVYAIGEQPRHDVLDRWGHRVLDGACTIVVMEPGVMTFFCLAEDSRGERRR